MEHVKVDLLTNCWEWQGPFDDEGDPVYELPDGTVVDAKVYILLAMEGEP